jgi:proline iminopeptidase
MKQHSIYALSILILLIACEKQHSVRTTEGYITGADSLRLFYRMVGTGSDTVVVLHGTPSHMNSLAPDLEPLAKGHTLLFYDQRGGRRSELVTDTLLLTWQHHVRDLEAVRQRFGIKRLKLFGWSWGSGLASLYAAEFPEHVERMFLLPMRVRHNPEPPSSWMARLDRTDQARMVELQSMWEEANDPLAVCREYWSIVLPMYLGDSTVVRHMRADFCDSHPRRSEPRGSLPAPCFARSENGTGDRCCPQFKRLC